MSTFSFEALDIPDAYLIHSFSSEDMRGSFVKSFERNIFRENGIPFDCTESFVSSSGKNVIRGMHFQLRGPQAKLVGVLSGKVFDVLVDLRKESPTFGQWQGFDLSAENRVSLLIPRGCAHGFVSLEAGSLVSYMCDGTYDKDTDTGIYAFDPEVAVEWPISSPADAVLGERDRALMSFAEFRKNCRFFPEV